MIEVEHRGYKITYHENAYYWRCPELDLQADQLHKLRGAIDKVLLEASRLGSGLVVWIIGKYDTVPDPVRALRLDDDGQSVWTARTTKTGIKREKHRLEVVHLATDENKRAVEDMNLIASQMRGLHEKAAAAKARLRPTTAEELRAAVAGAGE